MRKLFWRRRPLPLEDRGPLRVLFVITCMPVGGAETLLVELVRRMDRQRFRPELCCLKYLGPLGELLAKEIPAFTGLLAHKYDLRVLPRLWRLMRRRQTDAVVTVGTGGDKMFWGRLAAWLAGVPVICSALHSTGLPDRVEWLNRQLAPLTDAFIAVAQTHAQYLAKYEGCPPDRIYVIPNGVDTQRFRPRPKNLPLATQLGIPAEVPVVGIVAALRPEKNHELFLAAARRVSQTRPQTLFLIVGDGQRRADLEQLAASLGLADRVRFTGTRSDIPEVLSLLDVFVLCSHMEANPLSILEAMASGKPVVATSVGSIPEHLQDGKTGFLVPPGNVHRLADRILWLLDHPAQASQMGQLARQHVLCHASIQTTVAGYENLLQSLYQQKVSPAGRLAPKRSRSSVSSAAMPL
ncbi:MAG: glycosyltransferase [Thermoguttaceae bacterium]|nr:glycosyltransferase [Thermoguttaceae bacterium]MDW8037717.1 glycosyltransferase [Thermoguttaceae bacterium]